MRLLACRTASALRRPQSENELMDRESVERLRFDRRLQQRRDWVAEADYTAHAQALPDVSEKMTTSAELDAEEAAAAVAPPPVVHEPLSPPTPGHSTSVFGTPGGVAGDFTSSSTLGGKPGGFGGDSGGPSES